MSRSGSKAGDSGISIGDGASGSSGAGTARAALGSEAAVSLSSPPTGGDTHFRPLSLSATESVVLGAPFDITSRPVGGDRANAISLAPDRSIADHVAQGSFRHIEGTQEISKPGDGKTPPTIKVQFEDKGGGPTRQPDFIVNKDGSILAVGNLDKTKQSEIVIQVARDPGEVTPAQVQAENVEALTAYLSNRIKQEYPEAQANGVPLEDKQNLVKPDAERNMGVRNTDGLDNMPDQTRRQIEDMNRFGGGGGGRMPRRDADDYFPERTVPREPSESDKLAAMKDTIAGFATRGKKEPYEHVEHRPGRGTVFGRYGMGFNQVADWLESIDLENIEELERQGKVPKGTAARLRKMKEAAAKHKANPSEKIDDPFLAKLKGDDPDNPLTAQDVKAAFPKELQEIAANDMVRKSAEQSKNEDGTIDVGKVALSMHLGRIPTAEELQNPDSQAFMRAAKQAYQIAEQRVTNGGGPVDWTDANGKTLAMAQNSVGKVMWGDFASVVQGGRLGCAASVSEVLEQAGIRGIKSAGVVDFAGKAQRAGYEKLPMSHARPGDIVYGVEPGGYAGGSAHIGVVGQDGRVYHNRSSTGRWSEDSLHRVFNRGRFGNNLYVLRAPGSNSNA